MCTYVFQKRFLIFDAISNNILSLLYFFQSTCDRREIVGSLKSESILLFQMAIKFKIRTINFIKGVILTCICVIQINFLCQFEYKKKS